LKIQNQSREIEFLARIIRQRTEQLKAQANKIALAEFVEKHAITNLQTLLNTLLSMSGPAHQERPPLQNPQRTLRARSATSSPRHSLFRPIRQNIDEKLPTYLSDSSSDDTNYHRLLIPSPTASSCKLQPIPLQRHNNIGLHRISPKSVSSSDNENMRIMMMPDTHNSQT